ncbi:hypothetical protein THRCLA_00038 [Thraustotheca clavata]|uniref:Uncharacterized protein n=1 Tax=Thraustotheca clavata TaxID=74557 RepID=A0A1W0ACG6_9STRA|nr:hypothetical protein THRCLA_00038 [Thraustotheca clavata]
MNAMLMRGNRAFGNDTEAGRMLRKLYGGNTKPQINYPKVNTKRRDLSGPFIPGGGNATVDARSNKLAVSNTSRGVKVPTPCSNQEPYHAIDVLPIHRRPKDIIEKELAQIKKSIEGYKPRVSKFPGSIQEKEKLQQKFTYLPGSILPSEMLPGAELLDKELIHKNSIREAEPKSTLNELRKLQRQVLDEIDQRKRYLADMKALGKYINQSQMDQDLAGLLSDLTKIQNMIQEHS